MREFIYAYVSALILFTAGTMESSLARTVILILTFGIILDYIIVSIYKEDEEPKVKKAITKPINKTYQERRIERIRKNIR